MITQIKRTHEVCMGHRVMNHEGKCKNLHGHNYVFEFTIKPRSCLDSVGRVVDFSEVKSVLCGWLEDNWDHKLLLCENDDIVVENEHDSMTGICGYINKAIYDSVVTIPVNPTAENIADYFLNTIAPTLTINRGWYLFSVNIQETSKCSAYACLSNEQEYIEKETATRVPMPDLTFCKLQCGSERNCRCAHETDEMKRKCKYCVDDLPF